MQGSRPGRLFIGSSEMSTASNHREHLKIKQALHLLHDLSFLCITVPGIYHIVPQQYSKDCFQYSSGLGNRVRCLWWFSFFLHLICPKCDTHLHPLCVRLGLATAACFLSRLQRPCRRRAEDHGAHAFHVVLGASIEPDPSTLGLLGVSRNANVHISCFLSFFVL